MTTKPPSISANKLAEFIFAGPARQRQILKDQKFPTEFKGMYYREAAESISRVIAGNLEDLSPLENQKDILEQVVTDKVGTQRRIDANIDAIEAFDLILDDIKLAGATPSLASHAPEKLTIQGVKISVRPDVLLAKPGKSGMLIGGVKLHFPRNYALGDDGAAIVSALINEWCRQCRPDDGTPAGELCMVIDVGSRKAHPGVKATAARMKAVDAACQNIAALWPTIQP